MMLLLTLQCTEQRLSDGLRTQEPLSTKISIQYGTFFTCWDPLMYNLGRFFPPQSKGKRSLLGGVG